MKYLVTGGGGFLGQDVIDRLVKTGNEVVLFARKNPNKEGRRSGGEFFQGDITDIATLEACRAKHPTISRIVHLAALVPKTKDEDQAINMIDVNVCGTVNLLETFRDQLDNFVYVSTAEVYGLPQVEGPIEEDTAPAPLSNYGASKLAGELFSRVYGVRYNFPVSMLRLTVLYGPGDTIARAIPNFVNKALAGERLEVYGGEELRDYLHVSDAANAVYLAAIKPSEGVFNIGTGKGITIRDTAQKIAELIANDQAKVVILPREKKAADIVLDVERATKAFDFTAQYTFPERLEE